jgi:hypothetical protein
MGMSDWPVLPPGTAARTVSEFAVTWPDPDYHGKLKVPTWREGTDTLLAKLPGLLGDGRITINDARVIQYLAGLLTAGDETWT